MTGWRRCGPALLAAAFLAGAAVGRAEAGCIGARRLFAVGEAARVAFRQPSDIVLAGDRLLVLDDLNGRVALLDLQGRSLGSISLPGGETGSWMGLGFGGADQVFLASSGEGRIIVLDLKGNTVRAFPVREPAEGGDVRPAGVLVSRGSCFVADNAAHRIRVFGLDGRRQAVWGSLGEGPAEFRSPFRVAQDSLDRVLITDALNSRIGVFTPKGEPLLVFGTFGRSEGTLYRPAGLAVLEGDRVLVADAYFGSLQVFGPQGAYEGVLCGEAGRPLALESPTGLAARGRVVYAVEMGAGRVSAWEIGSR